MVKFPLIKLFSHVTRRVVHLYCRCADAPDVEVDVRMYEMKVIMDLCPRNKMSRCLCHDNTVMKAPFDLEIFFFQCRPKKV